MMILVCFLSFSRGFLRGFVYGLRGWMLDCPCPSLKLYCQLVDQLTTALPSKFGPGFWQPAWDLFAPTLQQYRAAVGEFSQETIVCVAPLHFTRLFCCSTASLSCWHTAAHLGLSPEPPAPDCCVSPRRGPSQTWKSSSSVPDCTCSCEHWSNIDPYSQSLFRMWCPLMGCNYVHLLKHWFPSWGPGPPWVWHQRSHGDPPGIVHSKVFKSARVININITISIVHQIYLKMYTNTV